MRLIGPWRRGPVLDHLLGSLAHVAVSPVPVEGLRDPVNGRRSGQRDPVRCALGQRVEQRDVAWFIAPKAGLRFTHYGLENTAPGQSSLLTRTIPTARVDTGVFFERDWSLGNPGFLQTLEPRLFYLYVPYPTQDELPIFDTGHFSCDLSPLLR